MYSYDTLDTLEGILELEFGFVDSFPASVVSLCRTLVEQLQVQCDSAVHFGTATGRGALELSTFFKKVTFLKLVNCKFEE